MTVARPFRSLTPAPADEPLKTAAEVAAYLGVSLQTLYDWRKHDRGPRGYRVGGRIQFRMSEVNAWLEQQREH